MKLKLMSVLMIACLMLAMAACKSKPAEGNTETNVSVETAGQTETVKSSETEELVESTEEPEEFKDAPAIYVPSETVEQMEVQESGEINIEEDQGGAL